MAPPLARDTADTVELRRVRSPQRAAVPQPRRPSRIPPARAAPGGSAPAEIVLLPVRQGATTPAAVPGNTRPMGRSPRRSPHRQPLRDRGNTDPPRAAHSPGSPSKTGARGHHGGSLRASSTWLGGLAEGALKPESDITGQPPKALQRWRVERESSTAAESAFMSTSDTAEGAASAAHPRASPQAHGGSAHPLSQPKPGGMTQLLATRLALAAAAEPPKGPPPGWEDSPEGIAARRAAATRAVNVPRGVILYPRTSPAAARAGGRHSGQAHGRTGGGKDGGKEVRAARASKVRRAAAARAPSGTVVPAPLMSDLWREEDRIVEVRFPGCLRITVEHRTAP